VESTQKIFLETFYVIRSQIEDCWYRRFPPCIHLRHIWLAGSYPFSVLAVRSPLSVFYSRPTCREQIQLLHQLNYACNRSYPKRTHGYKYMCGHIYIYADIDADSDTDTDTQLPIRMQTVAVNIWGACQVAVTFNWGFQEQSRSGNWNSHTISAVIGFPL